MWERIGQGRKETSEECRKGKAVGGATNRHLSLSWRGTTGRDKRLPTKDKRGVLNVEKYKEAGDKQAMTKLKGSTGKGKNRRSLSKFIKQRQKREWELLSDGCPSPDIRQQPVVPDQRIRPRRLSVPLLSLASPLGPVASAAHPADAR